MNRFVTLNLLGSAILALPVHAQTEEKSAESISVTATRNPLPIRELGASVIVISREEIEASGARTVAEVLQGLPGLSLRRTGGAGANTEILIRGDKGGHTLVMVDGIERADVSTIEKNYDVGEMPLDEVDRIEIVKGPHSVAYGASGLSGVIHIITRHPQKGVVSTFGLEAGSYDTYGARARVAGRENRLGYEVGISGKSTRGYSAAGSRDGDEADSYKRNDGRLRLTYGTDGPYLADLSINGSQATTDLDAGANDDDPNFQVRTREVGAQLSQRLKTGEAFETRAVVGTHQTERRYLDDPEADNPNRDQTWVRSRYQGERRSFELSEGWQAAEHHHVLLSAQWTEDRAKIKNAASYQGFDVDADMPEKKVKEFSYALQYQVTLWERLHLQTGGRTISTEAFGQKSVGQAALNIAIIPEWTTLRLNYGRGFKTPSIYQLLDPVYGRDDLQPESVLSGEAGLEQQLGGGISAAITGFQSETSQLIGFDGVANKYYNVNRALIKGLESKLAWAANPELQMQAQYTHLTTLDRDTNEPLRSRPDASWSGDILWKPSEFSLMLAVRGQTRSRAQPYVDGTEGFNVADVALGWQQQGWRGSLRVDNVMNTNYKEVAGYNTAARSVLGSVDVTL